MDLHTTRFTGRIARLFEADGFPPIAGRIFGLLLLSEDPRSLDDLAQGLGVSKASVSTNARRLAAEGVLERVPRPGDRRDYYRVTPDLFIRLMTERLSRWKSFTAAVGEVRRAVPAERAVVRRRLAEYESAYRSISGAIESALAEAR